MTKKRGLGKSLDALLIGSNLNVEDVVSDTNPSKEKFCQLAVDRLQRGKYQPRREMNSDNLQELATSITAQGVIQPLIVRPVLNGKYEIIAGERRWRAAQMAGLKEVPVIIRDIPDEAAIAIALIENIQRENLNPIEEAIALQRLLNEFSMTHQQVADAVGKSRTTVTNLLRLLSLSEEVKTFLEQGQLEMGHARALLSLSESVQVDAAQLAVNKQLSVRQTEELVRQLQLSPLPKTPHTIDPDVKRLQQDLSKRLQLAVAIKCQPNGKGKVVIQYKNLNELDKLMEYFE